MLTALAIRLGLGLGPTIEVQGPKLIEAPDQGWFTGIAVLFLLVTLVYVVLRWLAKRGVIDEAPARKLGRGLGNALVVFGSILQPDRPPPEDRPGAIEVVEDDLASDRPDEDLAPYLVEDGDWPSDGLRRPRT